MAKSRTCSLDGCDRKHVARGYCRPHWKRWREKGDPGPVEIRLHDSGRGCSVEGCDRPHGSLGFCDGHYQRFHDTGDAGGLDLPGPWTGGDATYIAVHIRLPKARGRASTFKCSCGRQADEWAYDHAAPDERRDELDRPYSVDLSHYNPMCRPCHRRFDARHSQSA